MSLRIVGVLFALGLSVSRVSSQTEWQINGEACSSYQTADAQLNAEYKQIRTVYSKDAVFLRKLTAAQRAWLTYRDAQLSALYPADDKQREYGSMYSTCRCHALQQLTEQRTKELARWVEGVSEGETCAGSVRHAAEKNPE